MEKNKIDAKQVEQEKKGSKLIVFEKKLKSQATRKQNQDDEWNCWIEGGWQQF